MYWCGTAGSNMQSIEVQLTAMDRSGKRAAPMANTETITITCPHCGATSAKSFSWAMTHFTTRCSECRKAYLIDRAYLLRTLQRLDIALKLISQERR
jgi:hypothetical protein